MRPGGGPFRNLAAELARQCPAKDAVDPTQIEQRLRSGTHGLIDAIYSVPGLAACNVLVVVDQFEEIFRFGDTSQRSLSELERTSLHDDALAFVATLLATIDERNPQVFVALTMRSDSLGRCDMFEGLPEAITRSQFLPPRMTREQLLDAIRKPLELYGSTIEDTVVSDLLEAMGDRQDQLPVIQHALAQFWIFASEGRQPRRTAAYHGGARAALPPLDAARGRAIGQPVATSPRIPDRLAWVTDAIATHADFVFDSLGKTPQGSVRPPGKSAHRQRIARAMFCALSQVDNLEDPERRLSSVDEVAGIVFGEQVSPGQLQQVAEVADAFGAEGDNFVFRSTTPDGREVLDVSHESLLRHWPRLREWLPVEAESARRFELLHHAAQTATWDNRPGFCRSGKRSQELLWIVPFLCLIGI